jgi:hypothetical protein
MSSYIAPWDGTVSRWWRNSGTSRRYPKKGVNCIILKFKKLAQHDCITIFAKKIPKRYLADE